MIRLPIPALTEERGEDLVKIAHRVRRGRARCRAQRAARHAAPHKELDATAIPGADDVRRADERAQKLTDEHVSLIDVALKHKEEEIMEV